VPGIFGVIELTPGRSEARESELVQIGRQMRAAMRYEPHFASLAISYPAARAYIGRVALSDGIWNSHIEKVAQTGPVVLTTGDILTSAESTLGTPAFVSGDVAEQLANRFAETGHEGLADLPGIHAGLIVDGGTGRCLLFNDKYGRERLFVHIGHSRLLFSSEAKAILAVVPETRAFDRRGLAEFLSCGCTLGTSSLFRRIEVLEAATALTVEGSSIRRERYFESRVLEQLTPASDNEFLEAFPAALNAAVNGYADHGPSVAVSLTGGLDSRMVMASLDRGRRTVPTYTFGSMYRTTADVSIAKQVAECCGQPHDVIELGTTFLNAFGAHLESAVYISDAYLGLSAAAELYVNRAARSVAPARMTGNWGGELMRGVRAFKWVEPKGGFLSTELFHEMHACRDELARAPQHPISAALFQQAPMQGYGRNAIERSQLVMRHPFLADDVVRWLYRSPAKRREADDTAFAVIGRRPELLGIPTDRGLIAGQRSRMRKATREALVKAEYLTSHGAPSWLSRVSARLPDALLETRFLGVDKFQHFRYWTRRDLAPFVRDTLSAAKHGDLGRWFEMSRVSSMAADHVSGRANYMDEIDKLLTLAVAQKTLFVESARQAA
jgi:asparagine synthase (glutamine-hydrolysing)